MSNAYLQIDLGGAFPPVRLERFLNNSLPRIDADGQSDSVLITASGSKVIQGTDYDNISLWNVDAYCEKEDFDNLCIIQIESKWRRQNGQDPNILVTDTTQYHRERTARTRALAPGTIQTTRGSYVLYYAQYWAIMTSRPIAAQTGNGFSVRFTLQETERTTP